MLSKIIFDLFVLIHYVFKTALPYKWDFCRLQLGINARLLINNGSYFVVYTAFTYWFTQYVLRHLEHLLGNDLHRKDRFWAYVISISAATQVFWPLFLLPTYFFSCSYYPWSTALAVLFLNFPSDLTVVSTGKKLQLLFQSYVDILHQLIFKLDTRAINSSESPADRSKTRLPPTRLLNTTQESSEERTEQLDRQSLGYPEIMVVNSEESDLSLNTSSEDSTEPSDSQSVIDSSDENVSTRSKGFLFLSKSLEEGSANTDSSIIRSPYASFFDLAALRKEIEDVNSDDSEFEKKIQDFPKRGEEIDISQTKHRFSTAEEESEDVEEVLNKKDKLTSKSLEDRTANVNHPIRHSPYASFFDLAVLREETEYVNPADSEFQKIIEDFIKRVKEIDISETKHRFSTAEKESQEVDEVLNEKENLTRKSKTGNSNNQTEGLNPTESTAENSVFDESRRGLGYYWHCILDVFRQAFTQLRKICENCSGCIYEQIRRLLNLPEYLIF